MGIRNFIGIAGIAAGMFLSSPAFAATESTSIPVSGEVRSRCDVAATPMRFVVANPGSNQSVDSTADIRIRCTRFTFFRVDIDYGQNANGTQRRMANINGDLLAYDVYTNAARTRAWGQGNAGRFGLTFGPAEGTWVAYGRIPTVSSFTAAGAYRDNLTVTINF